LFRSVHRIDPRGHRRRITVGLIGIVAAAVLAGCSSRDGLGSFIVDPGHYSVYHCKDFAPKLTSLVAREQLLRSLMDRASEGSGGAVICPPTEYDPQTGEATGEAVEVGPEGQVTTWAWVEEPLPQHPLDRPFAWVLVTLDGASTALLHILDVPGPDRVRSGMRVVADFRPDDERVGAISDIRAFVPLEAAG